MKQNVLLIIVSTMMYAGFARADVDHARFNGTYTLVKQNAQATHNFEQIDPLACPANLTISNSSDTIVLEIPTANIHDAHLENDYNRLGWEPLSLTSMTRTMIDRTEKTGEHGFQCFLGGIIIECESTTNKSEQNVVQNEYFRKIGGQDSEKNDISLKLKTNGVEIAISNSVRGSFDSVYGGSTTYQNVCTYNK